jgi:YVTN family beta-propeller protein
MIERALKTRGGALLLALAAGLVFTGVQRNAAVAQTPTVPPAPAVTTIAGMPPVIDARNLYSETASGKLSPAAAGDLVRIYVPNLRSNDVYVVDPQAMKVVDRFKVGIGPQHIVPSWDLRTLWATNNAEGRTDGSLTPIDPKTGKPGKAVMVDDPYNMYYTPDGKSAIVVAEARKRLDFRDPKTMAEQYSISVPGCPGINHADFSIDGRFAFFTCEFSGTLAKIDLAERKVLGYLKLSRSNRARSAPSRARSGSPVNPKSARSRAACRRTSAVHPTASASTSPICMPMVCISSIAPPSPRSASFKPAWVRTACIPAATASSFMSPTAARTRSTARAWVMAAWR